jgi:hypothetical protein
MVSIADLRDLVTFHCDGDAARDETAAR